MDIITRITRQRGKMQIVISEQETIVVPLSLFRERPLTEGQPINLEEYDNWLMVRQYRHALDRAVACLAARAHSKHEIRSCCGSAIVPARWRWCCTSWSVSICSTMRTLRGNG